MGVPFGEKRFFYSFHKYWMSDGVLDSGDPVVARQPLPTWNIPSSREQIPQTSCCPKHLTSLAQIFLPTRPVRQVLSLALFLDEETETKCITKIYNGVREI